MGLLVLIAQASAHPPQPPKHRGVKGRAIGGTDRRRLPRRKVRHPLPGVAIVCQRSKLELAWRRPAATRTAAAGRMTRRIDEASGRSARRRRNGNARCVQP
eukprot:scaffold15056_cov101-Isochrysis_galbana.AAC.2